MNITFSLVLFIFFIWLLVYGLVDRICRCIEHGHLAKSYDKVQSQHTEDTTE